MADTKISGLPSATTPVAGTEVLPIVQSGATRQVSINNLTAGKSVSAAGLAIDANSSTTAVRITQTGSGNAFLVEDSASTDTTPFVIDAAGSVGVGTATPSNLFNVYGPSIVSRFESTNNTNVVAIAYNGTLGGYLGANSTNLVFSTSSGAEAARITNSSELLVNTTSSSGRITSVGGSSIGVYTTSTGNHAVFAQASATAAGYAVYGNQLNATYGGVIGYDSGGKYGILGYLGYGLYTNASILVNGTTYTSDERLKENVAPISDALAVLTALNPVSFDWKPNSARGAQSDFGLIAQEVEKVIPECVFEVKTPPRSEEMHHATTLEEELGSYKGVDYSRFIPFLIAAVKEQQAVIDELKSRLSNLESAR